MAQQNVHYFPGHMAKALRIIEGYVKSVDLVVEILDARAPLSSRNPYLSDITKGKARILLLSKSDFADPKITAAWISYFQETGIKAIAGNLKKDRFVTMLSSACESLLSQKRAKEARFGMKPQPIRVMIAGIPNVGKSTLINNLGGRKIVSVGNKAGITRAEQWIKLSSDFVLLDTPGILPMNYPDGVTAVRLALLGSMREDVLPTEELCYALLGYWKENYPNALKDRFQIEAINEKESDDVLSEIASKRGLLEGGKPSITKAAYLIIKEYKDGLIGRYSLEVPPLA